MGLGLGKVVRALLRGIAGVPWVSIHMWIPGTSPTWCCGVPRLGSCRQRRWQGQQGCHPELVSLCDRITGLGERGTCVDRAHSDLPEAFDFLPPDILIKTCIRRN